MENEGNKIQELVDQYIGIKRDIKAFTEETLDPLEELGKQCNQAIKNDMEKRGLLSIKGQGGSVVYITKQLNQEYDMDLIMADLGIPDLEKYKKPRKTSTYIQVSLTK